MNAGKTLFAQVMEYAPWHTFRRLVAKYRGDFNVRSFSCLDQFLCMAFAQLTYRESLRDIEACLRAQSSKLYHLGFRSAIARNTLANANAVRDWRIYADFAQSLIGIAKRMNEMTGNDGNPSVQTVMGELAAMVNVVEQHSQHGRRQRHLHHEEIGRVLKVFLRHAFERLVHVGGKGL